MKKKRKQKFRLISKLRYTAHSKDSIELTFDIEINDFTVGFSQWIRSKTLIGANVIHIDVRDNHRVVSNIDSFWIVFTKIID